MHPIFITGTNTGVGKTLVSTHLIRALNLWGYPSLGVKPIASGAIQNERGEWENEDALALRAVAPRPCLYKDINPFIFPDPVAPHLAAQKCGQALDPQAIKTYLQQGLPQDYDWVIVEGVGGWAVPLTSDHLFADVVAELNLPVILVVGLTLGCLNHALLTYQHILSLGVKCLGWVGSALDPGMAMQGENIDTLKHWLKVPCLGILPYAYSDPDWIERESLLRAINSVGRC